MVVYEELAVFASMGSVFIEHKGTTIHFTSSLDGTRFQIP
jgi:hypothetical protein